MRDRYSDLTPLTDVARSGPRRGQLVLDDARGHVDAMLAAVDAVSGADLDASFDAVLDKDFDHVVQLVLVPFLREIGDRWEQGRLSVAHEHLASEILSRRLGAMLSGLPAGQGPCVILACPPHERHDLMLRCFALLLQRQGWRVVFLGPNMPTSALSLLARQIAPDLVVLASTRESVFESCASRLRRISADHRVAIAGEGATPGVAAYLGAVLLPPDPVLAVDTARELVGIDNPPDDDRTVMETA